MDTNSLICLYFDKKYEPPVIHFCSKLLVFVFDIYDHQGII